MKSRMNTKFLATTAVFIAIAIVLRSFSISIAAFGMLTMRISFEAICYIMPGILFGPLYGGIAGGLIDLLGYVITPIGGYIPLFTITNIAAGILPALIWKNIKNAEEYKVRNCYNIFFGILFLVGLLNFVIIRFVNHSTLGQLLTSLGKKSQYLSTGLMLIGAIGIMIFIINVVIKKNMIKSYDFVNNNYFKLIIAIGISGVLICTINTYILLIFTPALMAKGFMFLWVPRIIQALLMTIVNSYITCMIMYCYSLFQGRVVKKA
ncbi:folate family ECF transporter S component [Clostridium sp. AWRP]|uniref:folate family ECF transporter S component n=1 Tax=Clostridium sp. AWRP TaxID=2212991 RepID=UPI000FD8E497|nr:folate family ECF transporter S component [Clostridium sp. AWRP]AZV57291.1 folate family ECF transporter S component [Clostridium sp. AWRP]